MWTVPRPNLHTHKSKWIILHLHGGLTLTWGRDEEKHKLWSMQFILRAGTLGYFYLWLHFTFIKSLRLLMSLLFENLKSWAKIHNLLKLTNICDRNGTQTPLFLTFLFQNSWWRTLKLPRMPRVVLLAVSGRTGHCDPSMMGPFVLRPEMFLTISV